AVAGGHHRVRDAARDAAVVEAHVRVAVERPDGIRVRTDAALRTAQTSLPFGGQRRHAAVRRIRHEPHTAVLALEGVEDQVRRRTKAAGEFRPGDAGVELLVALLVDRLQLRGSEVLRALALELRRTLERRPRLVVVAEHAADVGIAPRGL